MMQLRAPHLCRSLLATLTTRSLTMLSFTMLIGCASYDAKPIKKRNASTLVNRYENEKGFVAAAERPGSTEEMERSLGRDLRGWDILPILTFMENRSADSNFEFLVADATFRLADGTEFERLSYEDAYRSAKFSGWRTVPWWFFAIVPGIFALTSVSGQNDLMLEDYREKSLSDQNMPTNGKSVVGFLFFKPVDKSLEECNLDEGILSLEITRRSPEGGEKFSVELNP